MSDAHPSLELLMAQQKKMLDEFADFRVQLTVLTAICMRILSRLAHKVSELEPQE